MSMKVSKKNAEVQRKMHTLKVFAGQERQKIDFQSLPKARPYQNKKRKAQLNNRKAIACAMA